MYAIRKIKILRPTQIA